MGAWNFVDRRIEKVLTGLDVKRRSGRAMSAARGRGRRRPVWPSAHVSGAGASWWTTR